MTSFELATIGPDGSLKRPKPRALAKETRRDRAGTSLLALGETATSHKVT